MMKEQVNTIAQEASPGLLLFEHTYTEFSYPKHFHESYLVELVEEGTEHFYCNGIHYQNVKSDTLVLINPGEVHTGGGGSIRSGEKLVCRVFYPETAAWNEVIGDSNEALPAPSPPRFRATLVEDKAIADNIKKIYALAGNPGNELLSQELYQSVMYDLLTRHMDSAIAPDDKYLRYSAAIERARTYINDNLTDKLVLDDIARAAFISPYHFLRVFKLITGITVHQYIISLRVERAKELLLARHSIQDVYTRLGFMNQVHFTKVFRKTTGLTPNQFRHVLVH